MSFNSILLALDGSAVSKCAAQVAWRMAQSTGWSVAANYVVDTSTLWRLLVHDIGGFIGGDAYADAHEGISTQLRSLGESLGRAYRSHIPNDVQSSFNVGDGAPPTELLNQLHNHDMLVIGHRKFGDMHDKRPSLAETLVLSADKPVLVVQGHTPPFTVVRMVVGSKPFGLSFLPDFGYWARMLGLGLEIYRTPNSDPTLVQEMVRHFQSYPAEHMQKLIAHDPRDVADPEQFGAVEGTLIVIPVVGDSMGRVTTLDRSPFDICLRFNDTSILFWPVEEAALLPGSVGGLSKNAATSDGR